MISQPQYKLKMYIWPSNQPLTTFITKQKHSLLMEEFVNELTLSGNDYSITRKESYVKQSLLTPEVVTVLQLHKL